MKKPLLLLLIPAILLLCAFPITIQAKKAAPDRYGYSLLTDDTQRTAYNSLVDCVSGLKESVDFTVSGITQDNVNDAMNAIKFAAQMAYRDHPEFFWYDGEVGIGINGDNVTLKPRAYTVNGKSVTAGSKDFKNAKIAFDSAINKALKKLNKNMSDYEIAHTIHDYLIDIITYKEVGDHQTAYGALVNGKAVCAGYTRSFQVIMNAAGIPCWYVSGKSYAPNGQLFGHAWNLVWLDGMCYYTDVTWDDQFSELFHEYMNLCKEEISATHFTNDPLPSKCGHDTYTFFIRNDGKGVCDFHGHKNEKEIAGCFELREQKGDTATYYCTIHYHGNDFHKWFDQHKVGIIKELGLSGSVSCNIIELGLEHHVTFSGKVKGQVQQPVTQAPTEKPTDAPVEKPTEAPTKAPAEKPTEAPTQAPTEAPTQAETQPETQVADPVPTVSATQPMDATVATEPATESDSTAQDSSDEEGGDAGTTIAIVGGSVATVGAGAGGYLWFLRRRRF